MKNGVVVTDFGEGSKYRYYTIQDCKKCGVWRTTLGGMPSFSRAIGKREYARLLKEHGGEKLLKTAEGRAVLNNLRQQYKMETLQPSDPDFHKVYGKDIKKREEARVALEAQSRREWKEATGREKGETVVHHT